MTTTSGDGGESGRVEWLELGPSSASAGGGGPGWPRPRRSYVLVLAAVVAAVVAAAIVHGRTRSSTAHPPHTAGASAPRKSTPAGALSVSPVAISEVGHRLLDVPADWELFARGSGMVVRIQLALGRITRTAVPPVGDAVSFVVGPDRAVLVRLDSVTDYLVPDGQPARTMSGSLSAGLPGVPVLAGPDPRHVWVQSGTGSSFHAALFGLDGSSTRVSISIPASSSGDVVSDGAGYLLFNDTGGVYDARPAGRQLVTTGALIGIGPTRWLTVECDRQDRCATVVIDRTNSARHIIGGPSDTSGARGLISPDGDTAALLTRNSGDTILSLRDLRTGADRLITVALVSGLGADNATLIWSPDSRWLFTLDNDGHIILIDARTAQTRDLGVALPRISQLALRTRRPGG